jgi:hypothetical protein
MKTVMYTKETDINTIPVDTIICAKDGYYVKRDTGFVEVLQQLKEIPDLEAIENKGLTLKMPDIPLSIFFAAWEFFKEVNDKHKSEAILLLTFDEKKQEYSIVSPKQKVSSASLDYETENITSIVGTIHSHNTMAAFHSGTDDKDEFMGRDGIHITLGHVDKSFPSISCSITMGKERYMIDFHQLFDFPDKEHNYNISEFMKTVSKKAYTKSSQKYGYVKDWDKWDREYENKKKNKKNKSKSQIYKEEFEDKAADKWWNELKKEEEDEDEEEEEEIRVWNRSFGVHL